MKKIIFTMLMSIGMIFSVNGQALKVASNGNIGIGVATPTAKFHMVDGTSNLYLKQSAFGTGLGKLIDITPGLDGSIRVGSINPGSNLFQGAVFQAWSDNAGAFKGQFYFDAGNAATAGLFFRTSLVTRMAIIKNGNVGIANGAPTERLDVTGNVKAASFIVSSDRRLKNNVSQYTGGLKEVLQLNPVHYSYNGKGGTTEGDEHIGLIAQELQEVAPEFVKGYTHKVMREATLEEDWKVLGTEDYLSIKDNEIKYLLVNAIKDQQKLIDEKDELIADLEARFSELEYKVNQIVNQYDVNLGGGGLSDAGLGQNRPNPFMGETQIAYTVPEKATSAQMNIFDLSGRLLKTISIAHTGKGLINVRAEELPAGTYSYQLVVDNEIIGVKKMIKSN